MHRGFVERLANRWGIGPRQRQIDASPAAHGSASQYVLDHYAAAVKRWRAERHDQNVGLLVLVDGDEQGLVQRRRQLDQKLREASMAPISAADPVAIFVPTWHIETWIAWLCGHRPVDELTRYKLDDAAGREVARLIQQGQYSPREAANAWSPAADDEALHVPTLTHARQEARRVVG